MDAGTFESGGFDAGASAAGAGALVTGAGTLVTGAAGFGARFVAGFVVFGAGVGSPGQVDWAGR